MTQQKKNQPDKPKQATSSAEMTFPDFKQEVIDCWNFYEERITKSNSRSMETVKVLLDLLRRLLAQKGVEIPDSFDFFNFSIGILNAISDAKAKGKTLSALQLEWAKVLEEDYRELYATLYQDKQTDLFQETPKNKESEAA